MHICSKILLLQGFRSVGVHVNYILYIYILPPPQNKWSERNTDHEGQGQTQLLASLGTGQAHTVKPTAQL